MKKPKLNPIPENEILVEPEIKFSNENDEIVTQRPLRKVPRFYSNLAHAGFFKDAINYGADKKANPEADQTASETPNNKCSNNYIN